MAVLAGLVLNVPGVWYLDALAEISRANVSFATELPALVVFNLIMFVLVEFPIVAYVVNPQAASAKVNGIQTWARAHARVIGVWVAIVAGVWLIVKGVIALV